MKTSSAKLLFFVFIIVILLLTAYNLRLYFAKQSVLGTEKSLENLSQEINFWESMVTQYPTYRDGWLNLAKLEFYRGNKDYAYSWLFVAKRIDPNSQEVIALEKELGR